MFNVNAQSRNQSWRTFSGCCWPGQLMSNAGVVSASIGVISVHLKQPEECECWNKSSAMAEVSTLPRVRGLFKGAPRGSQCRKGSGRPEETPHPGRSAVHSLLAWLGGGWRAVHGND